MSGSAYIVQKHVLLVVFGDTCGGGNLADEVGKETDAKVIVFLKGNEGGWLK